LASTSLAPARSISSWTAGSSLGAATVALVAGVLGLSSALEVRAVEKMQKSQGFLSRLFG
jgi:hypothetical protein